MSDRGDRLRRSQRPEQRGDEAEGGADELHAPRRAEYTAAHDVPRGGEEPEPGDKSVNDECRMTNDELRNTSDALFDIRHSTFDIQACNSWPKKTNNPNTKSARQPRPNPEIKA